MRKLIAAVLVVAVIAGGAYAASRALSPGSAAAPRPTPTTLAETKPSIRARGVLQPARQTSLAFGAGGRVLSVGVRAGDSVKAGQALAELDPRELDIQVKAAQDALTLSELTLEQETRTRAPEELAALEAAYEASQARYKEMAGGAVEADVLSAESALVAARQQLAQVGASGDADEQVARANLSSAKAKLAQLTAGPRDDDVMAAEIQVEQAKLALWSAQIARDALAGAVQRGELPEYQLKVSESQLASLELGVRSAEIGLARLKASPSKDQLAEAQTAVDQAQAQLAYRMLTREQSLASARASVAAAEARLERMRAGPTAAELASAGSAVARDKATLTAARVGTSDLELKTAKVRVTQAETALAQARLALEGTKLVAPHDGVVASVNVTFMAVTGSLASGPFSAHSRNAWTTFDLMRSNRCKPWVPLTSIFPSQISQMFRDSFGSQPASSRKILARSFSF